MQYVKPHSVNNLIWGPSIVSRVRIDSGQGLFALSRSGDDAHYGQRHMTWNDRITFDPTVMSGKPCIRGMRVTVSTVVGLVAEGRSEAEILAAYPYLESADFRAALAYAAWRSEERDVPLTSA